MQVIDIFSPKGGVGKTTLSVNIASCLANEGYKVALVDLDDQRSVIGLYKDADLGVTILSKVPPATSDYDFSVLDHHPSHKRKPSGDLIIMPMQANELDIRACKRAAANIVGKNLMLVMSRVSTKNDNQRMKWLEHRNSYDAKLMKERNVYKRANDAGTSVFSLTQRWSGKAEARNEIKVIVEAAKKLLWSNKGDSHNA